MESFQMEMPYTSAMTGFEEIPFEEVDYSTQSMPDNGRDILAHPSLSSSASPSLEIQPSFMKYYEEKKPIQDVSATLSQIVKQLELTEQPKSILKRRPESPRNMQDELDSLLNTSNAAHLGQSQSGRNNNRIGKPIIRYQSGMPVAAITKWEPPSQVPEVLYHKVEQIPWENNIVWENEDESNKKSTKEPDFVPEEDDTPHQHYSIPRATPMPNIAPNHSSIKREEYSTTSIIPTANANVPFDMTRPRNYRWEMPLAETIKRNTSLSPKMSKEAARIALDCALNPSLEDDTWLNSIAWDHCMDMPESEVILDENDTHLILTNPLVENVRATLRIPERKLGVHEKKQEQLNKQKREKNDRINDVMGNLTFGENTAEGRLASDELKRNKDTRIVKHVGHVHHSLPAIKLSLTKPELPKPKLREFHRPRGKFKINERLVLVHAKDAEKVTKASKNTELDVNDPALSQIKKTSDLNPTAGGKLILLEYIEQRPPMLSNPGMASRILHYWRPPESDTANDPSSKGKGKKKDRKLETPSVSLGQVVTLGPNDDTPFIGDVPAGKMVTSLNSRLFKIPIFEHQPRGSMLERSNEFDYFLLARSVSKKGGVKGGTTTYLMELPSLYVAGQVEPQMEVPAPNSRGANDFIRPYMSFHILRLFKKASDGERLKIEDIHRVFPNQSGTAIRKRMKEVATFERGGNDSGWWKKKPASELTSEDEIRANVSPESVCLYESQMSGHRRLMDMGLSKLFSPTGVQNAIEHLTKRLNYRQQLLKTKVLAPQGYEGRALDIQAKKLYEKDPVVASLKHDIHVARSIALQLELAPWTWTNNYVECHLQGKGSGMLQLGGDGDPSACGDGFSFIRAPQTRAKKKEGDEGAANDEAEVQKAVAAVTGTTADLRKLKMKEAGDVLMKLGMDEHDIKKLRRWDRIEMVRTLSTKASQRGEAGGLSKFARGARKSLNAQQQEYRKKCDARYSNQIEVLSSKQTEFDNIDDNESDEDSVIEELEDDIFGTDLSTAATRTGPVNMFRKDGDAFSRSKSALLNRDDAAELERLRRDVLEPSDVSTLRDKLIQSGIPGTANRPSLSYTNQSSTKASSAISSAIPSPSAPASRAISRAPSPRSSQNRGQQQSHRQALKRVTRTIEEDGTESVKIEFIVDPKRIGQFKANKQRNERKQKEEEREQMRKQRKRMQQLRAADDDTASVTSVHKLKEELKKTEMKQESTREYIEMLEKGEDVGAHTGSTKGAIKCTACGKVGHIRTNRNCVFYKDPSLSDSLLKSSKDDRPLKLTLKKSTIADLDPTNSTINLTDLREGARMHELEKKRKRRQDIEDTAAVYKRVYGSNKKPARSLVRLPIARLNGHLEHVLYHLVAMPESALFRLPVDGNVVRDYYNLIKRPMDLQRMGMKIKALEYDSMRSFIADLELMASNSRTYNGEPNLNLITRNAITILEKAKEALQTMNADGIHESLFPPLAILPLTMKYFVLLPALSTASIVYNFDPSASGGVRGSILVKHLEKGAEITADLDLTRVNWDALTNVDGNCTGSIATFKWHIHTKWTNSASSGFLSDCSLAKAGNHFDPTYACGPNSEHSTEDRCTPLIPKYKCTPETYAANPLSCESGDLSGKVGAMKAVDGKIQQKFVDINYPPPSDVTAQWNLMLHAVCGSNTPRFICATGRNGGIGMLKRGLSTQQRAFNSCLRSDVGGSDGGETGSGKGDERVKRLCGSDVWSGNVDSLYFRRFMDGVIEQPDNLNVALKVLKFVRAASGRDVVSWIEEVKGIETLGLAIAYSSYFPVQQCLYAAMCRIVSTLRKERRSRELEKLYAMLPLRLKQALPAGSELDLISPTKMRSRLNAINKEMKYIQSYRVEKCLLITNDVESEQHLTQGWIDVGNKAISFCQDDEALSVITVPLTNLKQIEFDKINSTCKCKFICPDSAHQAIWFELSHEKLAMGNVVGLTPIAATEDTSEGFTATLIDEIVPFDNLSIDDIEAYWRSFYEHGHGFALPKQEFTAICIDVACHLNQSPLQASCHAEALFDCLTLDSQHKLLDALEFLSTLVFISTAPLQDKIELVFDSWDMSEDGDNAQSIDTTHVPERSDKQTRRTDIDTVIEKLATGNNGDEFMAVKPWEGAIISPSKAPPIDASAPTVELTLDWIFGYSAQNAYARNNLRYLQSGEICYPAASVGVVMNTKEFTQRHNIAHTDDILSFTLHPSKTIIATGETGKTPKLIIWDASSIQVISTQRGYHSRGIVQLGFSCTGNSLVSLGADDDHSIGVYTTKDLWKSATLSWFSKGNKAAPLDVAWHPSDEHLFASVGVKYVEFWSCKSNPQITSVSKGIFGKKGTLQKMLCGVWMTHESKNMFIGGTQDGSLYIFNTPELQNVIAKAHSGAIQSLFLQDKVLVTGGHDGMIRTWLPDKNNTLTQALCFDLNKLLNYPTIIQSVALSSNMSTILLGTHMSDIFELNTKTGTVSTPIMRGHFSDELWGLSAHPTKQECATVGDDSFLCIWDLVKKTQLRRLKLECMARAVAYSPDGKYIAIGLGGHIPGNEKANKHPKSGAVLILYESDLSKITEKNDAKKWISDIKFSPCGKYLAAGSHDNSVVLYDVLKQYSKKHSFKKHSSYITRLDFSADSSYYQSTSGAYELLFCDVKTGKQVTSASALRDEQWGTWTCPLGWPVQGIWPKDSDGSDVNGVCRSLSGALLATGDDFGKVKIFRYPCAKKHAGFAVLNGHSSHVTNVVWSSKDEYLLSIGGGDRCLFVWKHDAQKIKSMKSGVASLLSPGKLPSHTQDDEDDELRVTEGDEFMAVKPWLGAIVPPSKLPVVDNSQPPSTTLKRSHVYGYQAQNASNNVRYLNNNRIVYHVAALGIVYDPVSNSQHFFEGHDDDIVCLALHPNGNYIATGQMGKIPTVHVWELSGSNCISLACLKGFHKRAVTAIAFSSDGSRLASVGNDDDHSIAIYKWKDGVLLTSGKGERNKVIGIAHYMENEWITFGDKHLTYWVEQGRNITGKKAHLGKLGTPQLLHCCCLIPDMNKNASLALRTLVGTNGGEIYCFENKTLTKVIPGHKGPVYAVCASVSKPEWVSGAKDGKIIIWDMNLSPIVSIDIIPPMTKLYNLSPESLKLIPTAFGIRSICFNNGNTRLLVGTYGSDIVQFDRTGVKANIMTQGHFQNELWGLAVHPDPGKHQFCTVGDDKTLRVWDSMHKMQLRLKAFDCIARSCAYSNAAPYWIAVGLGGRIEAGRKHPRYGTLIVVRDDESLEIVFEDKPSKEWLSEIKFSPNNTCLAVGSHDTGIYLYSINGNKITKMGVFRKHTSYITHFDFSHDSKYLQSNCGAYELLFSDPQSGKQITSARSLRDVIWETWTSTLGWPVQGIWPPCADGTDINSTHRSSSHTLLVTGDDFGKVKLFRYPCVAKQSVSLVYSGHSSHVTMVRWLHQDSFVISTGGLDRSIMQWAHMTGHEIIIKEDDQGKPLVTSTPRVSTVSAVNEDSTSEESIPMSRLNQDAPKFNFDAGDEFLAVKPWIGAICAPSNPPKENTREPDLKMRLEWVYGYQSDLAHNNIRYNSEGHIVYHAAAVGIIYDRITNTQKHHMGHTDDILSLSMSSSGRFVATGERGKKPSIRVWDAQSGELLCTLKGYHSRGVLSLAFALDEKTLASIGGDDDHSIGIWEDKGGAWSNGLLMASCKGDKSVNLFALSAPQPGFFVTGGAKHILFWSVQGKTVTSSKGQFGKLGVIQTLCCACNFKDNATLTGGDNGDLYVWTGNTVTKSVKAHDGALTALFATSKLDTVISGGKDGKVCVWNSSLQQTSAFS
ncbi:microtubule-associated protein, partial [Thraustotheca clavata]